MKTITLKTFSIFLFISFFSCTNDFNTKFKRYLSNGEYLKIINQYNEIDINNVSKPIELRYIYYRALKEYVDDIFNWSSAVKIVDTLNSNYKFYKSEVDSLISLSLEFNPGIAAAVCFRTGKFNQAFSIYSGLIQNNFNNISDNIEGMEASLAGIMMDGKIDENLFYNRENIISNILVSQDHAKYKIYIDKFLEVEKSIIILKEYIKNEATLNEIILKYSLDEEFLTDLFNNFIENKNYNKAKLVSYKLNRQYLAQAEFLDLYNSSDNEDAEILINKIKEFETKEYTLSYKIKFLLTKIKINTLIKLNDISYIKNYIDIELLYKMAESFYIEDNLFYYHRFNLDDEIYQIRNKVIATFNYNEEMLNYINNLKSIGECSSCYVLGEIIFISYLREMNFENAYETIEEYKLDFSDTFILDINDIVTFQKYMKIKTYGLEKIDSEIKQMTTNILNKTHALIDFYSTISNNFSAKFYSKVVIEYNDFRNFSISRNINEYCSVFDYLYSNTTKFNEKLSVLNRITSNLSGQNKLFCGKLPLYPIETIEDEIISEFFNTYESIGRIRNIHKDIIYLNLLLHCKNQNVSNELIYSYYLVFNDDIYFSEFVDDSDKINFLKQKDHLKERAKRELHNFTYQSNFELNYLKELLFRINNL